MGVAVTPVRSSRERLEFIRLPARLNAGSPWYVPPLERERRAFLDPSRNPFFDHAEAALFLARDAGGTAVGRVSAHLDRAYDAFHGGRTGFFGFFDCADDPAAARALLAAAEAWLRERGAGRVLGPVSFTTNHETGALVDGFEGIPFLMMPWNPPHYDALIAACGYARERDLYAYLVPITEVVPPFIARIGARARRSARITTRTFDPRHFRRELDLVKTVYNGAWARNWGFVPLADAEIEHMAREMRPLIDPELGGFVFVGGELAGFILGMPDYNLVLRRMGGRLFPFGFLRFLLGRRRIDRMRVLTMGVIERWRHLGLESVMIEDLYRRSYRRGIRSGEISWILEDNGPMNAIARRLAGAPYRTYRVYARPL